MTIHITKDSLMDHICEIRDVFILEAEYTEEELKRLNAPDGSQTAPSASAVTEPSSEAENRIMEHFPTMEDADDDEPKMKPEEAREHKASTIVWITLGVALAAAAILLIVFFWNPNHSDVISTEDTESRWERLRKAEVGDHITYGVYEQDGNLKNGSEEVEWLVLAKEDDRMLVISRFALGCQAFKSGSAGEEAATWETSALREWLNSTFYETAFGYSEKSLILSTTVVTAANPNYGTPGGNDVTDKVFLLSAEEANRYFADDNARRCQLTPYGRTDRSYEDEGYCWWWLRSPGQDPVHTLLVYDEGWISEGGDSNWHIEIAFRPAMWIDLRSYDWQVNSASSSFGGEKIPIDKKHFPDQYFRSYIRARFDKDRDEYLDEDEIASAKVIRIYDSKEGSFTWNELRSLKDLSGLEYFTALEELGCSNLNLKQVDVSHNPALKELELRDTKITELDVTGNPMLELLDIEDTSVKELDLSNNTELKKVIADGTSLESINLTNSPNMEKLVVDYDVTVFGVERNKTTYVGE